MLYKNDEQYKLTAEDIKTVKQKFRKFPVRLTYPEDRIRPSLSAHNTLPDKPASMSFPLNATVKTKSGADRWRYAENRILDEKGNYTYLPHNLLLTGTFILQENDIELIWYLWTKCPYTYGGLNYNGKKPKCVFEDLISKAEVIAEREAQLADVNTLIYSTKLGIPEPKMRQVAKALFIPDVDDLTFAQVKVALRQEINRDKANGAKKFLDMIESDVFLEIRSSIQSAIDRKLIKYNTQKKAWVWITSTDGKKTEPICEITASADPYEALMELYKGDQKFAQALQASLKGKKVVLTDGAGTPDDDENNEG